MCREESDYIHQQCTVWIDDNRDMHQTICISLGETQDIKLIACLRLRHALDSLQLHSPIIQRAETATLNRKLDAKLSPASE